MCKDNFNDNPKTRQELKKKGKYNTKDKTYNSRYIRKKLEIIENTEKNNN
jgi:hypothetical protein